MMIFRSLLFVVYMYGLMAIMGLLFLPSLLLPKGVALFGIRTYAKLLRAGLHLIGGIRTEIVGEENLPEGGYIYAGKHQCMWDVFIPFIVCKAPTIIMKRELLWYPFLGWFALKAGMIPIDRAGTTKTLKKMTAVAKDRADHGRQIVIFPEGTRTAPGEPVKYHAAGLSSLYKALGTPVALVATNAGLCWPAHGLKRKKGVVTYEILPPVPAGLPRKEAMARIEAELEEASLRLYLSGLMAQGGQSLVEEAINHD